MPKTIVQQRELVKPTAYEVGEFLLSTLKHVFAVEYFTAKLGVYPSFEDGERPHDISGEHSKVSFDVIRGLALQYKKNTAPRYQGKNWDNYCAANIMPSVDAHRLQRHHRMYGIIGEEISEAADLYDIQLGAIDAICSMCEQDRNYQGFAHDHEELMEKILSNRHPRKRDSLVKMKQRMLSIPSPETEHILNLRTFHNIGLPDEVYARIRTIFNDALEDLVKNHQYDGRIIRAPHNGNTYSNGKTSDL